MDEESVFNSIFHLKKEHCIKKQTKIFSKKIVEQRIFNIPCSTFFLRLFPRPTKAYHITLAFQQGFKPSNPSFLVGLQTLKPQLFSRLQTLKPQLFSRASNPQTLAFQWGFKPSNPSCLVGLQTQVHTCVFLWKQKRIRRFCGSFEQPNNLEVKQPSIIIYQ